MPALQTKNQKTQAAKAKRQQRAAGGATTRGGVKKKKVAHARSVTKVEFVDVMKYFVAQVRPQHSSSCIPHNSNSCCDRLAWHS